MVSLIAPSYNNLRHLKNLVESYNKWGPDDSELIIVDDYSDDGTEEWVTSIVTDKIRFYRNNDRRVGHTVLYDWGIEKAKGDVVGILHADMILGKNCIENMLKHLRPGSVVCATRVEPPLHPPSPEKIIKPFGIDFDTLDIPMFDKFVDHALVEYKDLVSQGMFAPWILYKKDWDEVGGHDHVLAPFPFEDSDIFQRWLIHQFQLLQSKDAIVYHLTCRGHKWNKKLNVEDDGFEVFQRNASRNFTRKWGTWIENDEHYHPIVHNKYDIGFVIKNCTKAILTGLEIWASDIYVDCTSDDIQSYVKEEQQTTMYDLESRVHSIDVEKLNDVIIHFDADKLTNENILYPNMFNKILDDSGTIGSFKLDIFDIKIKELNPLVEDQLHVFKKNVDI